MKRISEAISISQKSNADVLENQLFQKRREITLRTTTYLHRMLSFVLWAHVIQHVMFSPGILRHVGLTCLL